MRTTTAVPATVKLRDTIEGRSAANPSQFALPDDSVTDGEGKELSLMVGVNSGDGRGNITAYATVFDSEQVLQARSRLLGLFARRRTRPAIIRLRRLGDQRRRHCSPNFLPAYGSTADLTVDTQTRCVTFDPTLDLYNFGPLNHYQRPERRYSLGAMGHYEFGEHADVYTQLMFTDYESVAQIAPGGNFCDTDTVNCDNPLLPGRTACATIGCDAGGDRCRQLPCRCTSCGATSRAADGSSRSRTTSFRVGGGCARRDQRRLGLRRVGAVLQTWLPTSRRSTTS